MKIGIIGAGQLGSRHLQGVKIAEETINIDVVDPSEESLRIAKQRYEEIPENNFLKKVCYLNSISQMSGELDLVIIATSSKNRLSVIKDLLSSKKVKNMILEKVLFQTKEEYYEAEKLFEKYAINVWVNCPRRMFSYYKNIKDSIQNDKIIFQVVGGDWGLGCNGIHFIDCLAYLSGQREITITTNGLDNKIHSSKREGYYEFSGTLTGKTERGDVLVLSSLEKMNEAPIVTILSGSNKFIIDEINRKMILSSTGNLEIQEIEVPFQSQLTGRIIKDLINNEIELTSYKESMELHLPFVKSLLEFYNDTTGEEGNSCPIT
ncbi:Gfo/Idh/MocA family oxidoreductase [Capnocytophaga felis]|uniref:Gfo/Idh/MocA-like oxidoreductase N-terminal domain-containing protein n=1 Tax=Capnocytophaga felis TaxID=2267611 RepID=A0A5M4B6P0_9FLAO|nr:Gfo/Idh/MocA family oxidoreductase [Capnocytophaga felis]GET45283.1 hypothetical protein RCZ01_05850 [Capnocytophaga felis]GET47554.1 hypothetical protein RCZ02_03850 [Capnocytophaga felis]